MWWRKENKFTGKKLTQAEIALIKDDFERKSAEVLFANGFEVHEAKPIYASGKITVPDMVVKKQGQTRILEISKSDVHRDRHKKNQLGVAKNAGLENQYIQLGRRQVRILTTTPIEAGLSDKIRHLLRLR